MQGSFTLNLNNPKPKMRTNEKLFFERLKILGIQVFPISRSETYQDAIDSLERISNKLNQIVIGYELRLGNNINQYPDFVIVYPKKKIFIKGELKFKENRATVIKEMRGMRNEFWYVLSDFYSIEYMETQTRNSSIRILTQNDFIDRVRKII